MADQNDPAVFMAYANKDLEKVTHVAARMNALAQSLALDGYSAIVLYPDNTPTKCENCGHES